MSIIQEALKKAQKRNGSFEPVRRREPARRDIPEEIAPYYARKQNPAIDNAPTAKNSAPRIIVYGVILACVIAALIINYYPSKPAKKIEVKTTPVINNLKDPIKPAVAVIPAPVIAMAAKIEPVVIEMKPAISQDDFKLSGIMDLEDGRKAIVNNLVVVEGDNIGDVRVETITTRKVTLKKGRDSLTLQLK